MLCESVCIRGWNLKGHTTVFIPIPTSPHPPPFREFVLADPSVKQQFIETGLDSRGSRVELFKQENTTIPIPINFWEDIKWQPLSYAFFLIH